MGLALPLVTDEGMDERSYEPSASASGNGEFTSESRLAAVQEPAESWSENTVLERQSDGHFYADVRIDGRSYRMLVDTGASVVALTGADAASMGMEWFEDDISPVAQGAGGPISGVNTTIDRITVGGHEANGVRAIIIPEGAGISLLGQSFLSTIGSVEITGDRMVLGN